MTKPTLQELQNMLDAENVHAAYDRERARTNDTNDTSYKTPEEIRKYLQLQYPDAYDFFDREWARLKAEESQDMTGTASTATKHDGGKVDLTLIPSDVLEGVARVFEYGAAKYGRHNFRSGDAAFASRCLRAGLRHAMLYGEQDTDPETGESHLLHALCSFIMAEHLKNKLGIERKDLLNG